MIDKSKNNNIQHAENYASNRRHFPCRSAAKRWIYSPLRNPAHVPGSIWSAAFALVKWQSILNYSICGTRLILVSSTSRETVETVVVLYPVSWRDFILALVTKTSWTIRFQISIYNPDCLCHLPLGLNRGKKRLFVPRPTTRQKIKAWSRSRLQIPMEIEPKWQIMPDPNSWMQKASTQRLPSKIS